MPKKVYAVTNIKIGQGEDEYFAAGTEVNPKKFTMEQLKSLHDEGAVEIKVVEDVVAEEASDDDELAKMPTKEEMKDELRELELPVSGTKEELAERLETAHAEEEPTEEAEEAEES